jgi:hypothetical protein
MPNPWLKNSDPDQRYILKLTLVVQIPLTSLGPVIPRLGSRFPTRKPAAREV